MDRQPCGCPAEPWRYGVVCYQHARPRHQTEQWARHSGAQGSPQWYQDNCCQFCGRVNPFGLACQHVETCELCGVVSCDSHPMACYKLSIICPKLVNPRSKHGRAWLRTLREGWIPA